MGDLTVNRCVPAALAALVLIAGSAAAELYNRAPDVQPGTLPEMRDPAFWIGRMAAPDEVILTRAEIAALNERFRKRMTAPDPFAGLTKDQTPDLTYWWPGLVWNFPDLHAAAPAAAADTVRARINSQVAYLRKQPWGNAQAVPYRPETIDALAAEMNLDAVPAAVTVRDGIAVRTMQLRNVPSFLPSQQGITENAKNRWDLWNVGVLHIGRPVTILHVSRSGEYLLVLCDIGFGWAKAEDIALGTRDKVRAFAEAADFVVCTTDREFFYTDRGCTIAAGWFGMGDRLPQAPGNDSRQVLAPIRAGDGSLATAVCRLRPDALVSDGWQPYTRRNIVQTAFRMLDLPYDWTGGWLLRQHETTYRDLFATFGFDLPVYGALFTFYGETPDVMLQTIGKEAQYKRILEHEPFVTVQSCGGHAQLLLGELNGTPIVFDNHGYNIVGDNGEALEVRRVNIGTVEMPTYFLKRNVTFLELK